MLEKEADWESVMILSAVKKELNIYYLQMKADTDSNHDNTREIAVDVPLNKRDRIVVKIIDDWEGIEYNQGENEVKTRYYVF